MRSHETVEEWARTAEFPEPIVWGDVEAGILTREPRKGPGLPVGMWVRVALAWVGIAAFVIVVFGASLFGLVFVILGNVIQGLGWDWDMAARVAFVVAILVEVPSFLTWLETRRRSAMSTAVSTLTLVASVAAWIVILLGEGFSISWLSLFVTVAAVSALVVLVLGLRSKPEGRPKNRYRPVGAHGAIESEPTTRTLGPRCSRSCRSVGWSRSTRPTSSASKRCPWGTGRSWTVSTRRSGAGSWSTATSGGGTSTRVIGGLGRHPELRIRTSPGRAPVDRGAGTVDESPRRLGPRRALV